MFRRSGFYLLFVLPLLGLALMRETRQPPLAGLEEAFVSWLAANSVDSQTPAPVALVEIDDESLHGHPWPWSPLDYALFLNGALPFQPAVTAIEPVLSWNDKELPPDQLLKQPQYVKILHDRILRTPKLLLGAQLGFPEDSDVVPPLQPMPVLRHIEGAVDAIPEFTVVEASPGEDIRLSAALGFTNIPNAREAARTAPLLFRYRGELVPSFVLQGLMLWYGLAPDDVRVRPGSSIQLGDKGDIPIDRTGAMLIDWKTPYARAAFDDLLLSVEQTEAGHTPVVAPEKIRGKEVILVRTDEKARTLLLPSGQRGSAGELFAAALATAETRSFVRSAGWLGNVAVLALAVGLEFLLRKRPKLYAMPIAVVFLVFYLLGTLLVFESARAAMPFIPMLGLAILAVAGRLAVSEAKTVSPQIDADFRR